MAEIKMTEAQAVNMLTLLYTLYANQIGVEIESITVTRKDGKRGDKIDAN